MLKTLLAKTEEPHSESLSHSEQIVARNLDLKDIPEEDKEENEEYWKLEEGRCLLYCFRKFSDIGPCS